MITDHMGRPIYEDTLERIGGGDRLFAVQPDGYGGWICQKTSVINAIGYERRTGPRVRLTVDVELSGPSTIRYFRHRSHPLFRPAGDHR